ncbi:MAG: 50S ribosomal protein L21, partial [Deltaproteobacteria bacterium]|nr:50S ribosomal protein L21 [Deltaproteobacteria bacterium]
GAKVVGRIIRQGKDRKIVVLKFKRRKGYRRKQGHRQLFSLVKIENIET